MDKAWDCLHDQIKAEKDPEIKALLIDDQQENWEAFKLMHVKSHEWRHKQKIQPREWEISYMKKTKKYISWREMPELITKKEVAIEKLEIEKEKLERNLNQEKPLNHSPINSNIINIEIIV